MPKPPNGGHASPLRRGHRRTYTTMKAFSTELQSWLAQPRSVAIIAFLLTAMCAGGLIRYTERDLIAVERAQVTVLAGNAHVIESEIHRALSATETLAFLVRREGGGIKDFLKVGQQMLPHYQGVIALQLAPGGVIQQSVPLAGNEKAIGHDLLQDPHRNKEAFLARDTGQLTLAGPFKLIQGGEAMAGRLPVFLNDVSGRPTFWGFTTALISLPDILKAAQFDRLVGQGLDYRLSRIHPDTREKQTIAASSVTALTEPVAIQLKVPNSVWTLEVAPTAGWGKNPVGLSIKIALAMAFAVLVATLARSLAELARHRRGLEQSVINRTREVVAAQRQLQGTLDAIPDFLFELDLDGCFHECHSPHADLWPCTAETLVGQSIYGCFPDHVTAAIMSAVRATEAGTASPDLRLEVALPQSRHWFELSVSRKAVEHGESSRFIVLMREITEKKRAEEARNAVEQRFRDMVNTTDGIVWEADATTFSFTFISEKAERLLGYPVADWLKPGFWVEHLHPDDQGWAPAFCAACTGRLEPHDFEYRSIAADGRTVWLRDIVTVVAENGAPRWLRGIMVDITQRKIDEMALQENAAKYLAITQSANDAIVTANSDGNIAGWNRRAELMFGYTEAEVMAQPLTMLMPERYRQRHADGIGRLQHGQPSYMIGKSVELDGLHKNGREFPIELSIAKWEVGGNCFVSGTIRDITERRQNEANMQIAATAFESQEGMFITDAAKVIIRVNQAFCEITGYSPDEAIGKTPRMLSSGRHDDTFFADMTQSIQQTGMWRGEVWNRRKNGEVYPEWLTITTVRDPAGSIVNYVAALTDITFRKMAEEEIQKLAYYDPLTQLPNRRLLLDRMQQAVATSAINGKHGALLFIDLDNFKDLNDNLGHHIGDLLLTQVAGRLVGCVRESDTVARLGGDEFIVMLEDLSEFAHEAAAQARVTGELILNSLNQAYTLVSHEHRSTPSIGVTLFAGHQATIEDLLKWADLAMYQAKAAGRNTLRFFDPDMQAAVTERVALEEGLRDAIANDQFALYYQAQVNSAGQLTGVEALLRWAHPERGLVPPSEFIPLAEETGVILPLGAWVLQTACRQLAAWAHRPEMAHLTIAVNVSPRQFHDPDFVDQVLKVLAHTGANPQRLKLELTESLLVEDVDDLITKMSALKAQGVGFSLDDFGTGYSSLSYLKRLPLDQLKIDQGFVRDILVDPNDAAIARMVIALAESMGLAVIAEGVELETQRDLLARQGCHAYQGYLFARPLPLDQFEDYASRVRCCAAVTAEGTLAEAIP